MRLITCAGTAFILALAAQPVHAQAPRVDIDITGRVQLQWNSTSVDEDDIGASIASSTFETRRVRLGVGITIDDWIRGFIEPDYALGDLQLKNAWVALEIDPALVIRAGQFKKPFSLIHLASSTSHPMIERGVRIRGLDDALLAASTGELSVLDGELLIGELFGLLDAQGYLAYDIGAAIEGTAAGFEWAAGVFNGTGPDTRDENDGKSLAARVAYAFDVGTPITVGAAWSRRELEVPAVTDTRTGDAFEVDIELGGFRRGAWLLAEASTGTNLATEERFIGAHGIASYFFGLDRGRIEGIEPMVRVSWADPDDEIDGDDGMLFTPGFNLYFAGRNRLMFNWDVYVPGNDAFDTHHAARAQLNLHF